jgi:hypothetical protein
LIVSFFVFLGMVSFRKFTNSQHLKNTI